MSQQQEERLAGLLAELTDRWTAGDDVDIDRIAAEHPELGDELRELWGAVMLADAVSSQSPPTTPRVTDGPEVTTALELPCRIGDYELQAELGRGGMGIVYKARQVSLQRTVALKMLLRGRFASPTDQARFRAEAEAAAQLDHPHIVPLYEIGQLDGSLFFTMKHVEGETLAERMAAGPMNAREAARIMLHVANAIQFAHSRGVLHRDLKPSNILLDRDGQPHVTDFGLAKQGTDASLTRTGAVLGTPAYMSPEQAAGNRGNVGPASDVYSLGTILYHMITGRPPFQGDSPVDVVLMVLEQDPPLARSVNPHVDRRLEMISLRCLQKPPDLRYASAQALGQDLQAFLADEPIAAQSGRLEQVAARAFRETHHAPVLKNWGLLWMWHSLVLLVVCVLTNCMQWSGYQRGLPYFLMWTAGLGIWAVVFWILRQRVGPVTFVERQIAHLWAGSMISIALLFPIEYLMGMDVLDLSPMLGLISGVVFLAKAGILSGTFYVQAISLFACSLAMAQWPNIAHLLFGIVSALCFFIPGWRYHRLKLQEQQTERERAEEA
jgi:serine/threonine-protein kinase